MHSRLGRHVLQRCQQRVRDEEFCAPSLNRCVGLPRSADDAGGLSSQAVTFVAPWPPPKELSAEIGNEDRELAIERRDLVLEVHRVALVRQEKHLEDILGPQVLEI